MHDGGQVAARTVLYYSGRELIFESTSSVAYQRHSFVVDFIWFGFRFSWLSNEALLGSRLSLPRYRM